MYRSRRQPTRARLSLSLVVVGVLVAAGCGQKPGVSVQPAPAGPDQAVLEGALPPGAQIDPATGQIIDAEGNVIGDASELAAAGDGAVAAPGDSAEGAGSAGTTEAVGTSGEAPRGGNTTGVDDTTIKIGAHAPLTGAAPIPSDSAEKGVHLYWEWLEEIGEDVNGRRVEAILKNDNYNPSQAVAVCKEMVEKDKVFILFGFAGTDQIQACARYAASVGVPYVSVGVTEVTVESLPNYFAASLSYPEQAPLLTDLLTTQLGARREKNGMLRFDTPNFEDAHEAFVSAMDESGAPLDYDRSVSKNSGQTEAQAVVQEMKTKGIENVFVLTSPVWFLQVLQAARSQDYAPQWVGVGITMALDTVASVGCRNGTINKSKFFSPFPAWADINSFDPDFHKAVQEIYPDEDRGDDVMLIGWSLSKVLAELLAGPGRDLSRERFVYFSERSKNVRTDVFPPVSFTPSDHFGGTQVHLNEAQCSGYRAGDNRWHTIKSFVGDF